MIRTVTWDNRIEKIDHATEESDETLMRRIERRDSQALRSLYDRYSRAAFGLAYRILGDRPTAEEIIQEAFWRVWKRAGSYAQGRGQASTWLMSIVHHLAIYELRRRRSRPINVTADVEDDNMVDLPDLRTDVAATVFSNLTSEQVRAAVKQLPESLRRVLEMAYFEGLTHQEIAKQLGEPLGTIHTRARTGLVRLRECLTAQVLD